LNTHRYDRLALADSVLQRVNDKLQTSTYLEFKEKYEGKDFNIKSFLQPAKEFLRDMVCHNGLLEE
jgi:hypothetical protein